MKRFTEKVKDIVDVRSYRVLSDLHSEPFQTISTYHFSDHTTDLMVRWLDEISNGVAGRNCRAIAGYRGVGKSHFLAAFCAIASHPEVRSSISEPHVSSAAQRLLRRHYPVINVRRGTRASLVEELAVAAAQAFDKNEGLFSGSAEATLEAIKSLSGDLPPIVVIDTASDRSAPVERNDGDVLAEISSVSSRLGVFVGLALDDDIAEADGSNLAISQSFAIDYLDPEHLHKVVSTLIFPKRTRMQAVLTGVYTHFRDSVPQFRWSEQRFVSLYPLHPATLDLAPFIRAYVPNFALLGFAAEAGEKIQGRPADSLIGYEEVFDTTEQDLRKVSELESAFTAHDELVAKLISELPATERHQAKLILKTLLILSLSGRGSTVDDIVGAMMLVDNGDLQQARHRIEATLNAFAQTLPNAVIADRTGTSTEFAFKIGSNKLAVELDELASQFDENDVQEAYFRAVCVRFPELNEVISGRNEPAVPSELAARWRGSLRYGKVFVYTEKDNYLSRSEAELPSDWELHLRFEGSAIDQTVSYGKNCSVEWIADPLTVSEKRVLAANHVLKSNTQFRAKHGDQLSALIQTYSRLVDVLVERTLVGDAKLVIDGFDYNFSDTAREASSLGEMMSVMLEPLFESLYYEHPYFPEVLNDEAVEAFVKEICGNSAKVSSDNTDLAIAFGEPLGLLRSEGGKVTLKPKVEMVEVPGIKRVLGIFGDAGEKPTPVREAFLTLNESPLGLSRQAVRIVLSSMAANGLVDFVTSDGERISGRSLDLKLDWGAIDSIAKPSITKIPRERLIQWAGVIAGDDSIRSLDQSEDRSKVLQSLVEISAQWEKRNPLQSLSAIPETEYNTAVWRGSTRITEGYSELVATIDEALVGNIDLAVCVERISEEFSGRPSVFHEVRNSVRQLEEFGSAYALREKVRRYLTGCDISEDAGVEEARSALISLVRTTEVDPSEAVNRELGYAWEKFHRLYVEAYQAAHKVVESLGEPRSWIESMAGKEHWSRFLSVLSAPAIKERFGKRFREQLRRLKNFQCTGDPVQTLGESSQCSCSFAISDATALRNIADEANRTIEEAIWGFERIVAENVEEIRRVIEQSSNSQSGNDAPLRSSLLAFLDSGVAVSDMPQKELDALVAYFPAASVGDWWHPSPFNPPGSSSERTFGIQ